MTLRIHANFLWLTPRQGNKKQWGLNIDVLPTKFPKRIMSKWVPTLFLFLWWMCICLEKVLLIILRIKKDQRRTYLVFTTSFSAFVMRYRCFSSFFLVFSIWILWFFFCQIRGETEYRVSFIYIFYLLYFYSYHAVP